MGIGPISGFGDFGGLYGSYRMQNIPLVDEKTVRAQDAEKAAGQAGFAENPAQSVSAPIKEEEAQDRKAARVADLQNISLTFNKEDDFGYIGSDAPLSKLDMEKAISDMKKDSALEQYQYFVGNRGMDIANTADGSVMLK